MAESRTYTILGVVGSGGFGKVYRARLRSGSGFSKDVAIKVLHNSEPDAELLSRFRDEARILALLRDRAIVSVDPPTRLSGRWAVVMDFVDGLSGSELLKRFGVFPPGVAVEIVGELSRALDKAYHFKGPEGSKLELLHRDIKPANIQITPTGEVKLLDFGVARASFGGREAKTTRSVSGTPGYMAPERLQGVEGPEGDVYGLGVVLWVLLTGEAPSDSRGADLDDRARELAAGDPHLEGALLLASEMRRLDEEERPSHREIERRCRVLRQSLPEPWLRDWAEQIPEKGLEEDDLAGQQLSETLFRVTTGELDPIDPPSGSVSRTLLLGTSLLSVSAIGLGVAIIVLIVLIAGVGVLASLPAAPPPIEAVAAPEPVEEPEPVADPEPVAEPEPVEEPEPAPAPAPPPRPRVVPVVPAPAPEPAPEPAPRPAPAPVQAVAKTVPVTFRSIPWGARVTIDGADLGPTPLMGRPLTPGKHTVVMALGEVRISKTIRVGARHPNSYKWSVSDGADGWQSSFAR